MNGAFRGEDGPLYDKKGTGSSQYSLSQKIFISYYREAETKCFFSRLNKILFKLTAFEGQ